MYAVSLILAEWWPERDGSLTGWLPDFGNKEMADTAKALTAFGYMTADKQWYQTNIEHLPHATTSLHKFAPSGSCFHTLPIHFTCVPSIQCKSQNTCPGMQRMHKQFLWDSEAEAHGTQDKAVHQQYTLFEVGFFVVVLGVALGLRPSGLGWK